MSFKINVTNNLPQNKNSQIKVHIKYTLNQDDIAEYKTYSTPFMKMNSNNFVIDTERKLNNIYGTDVYLVYGNMGYKFKFANVADTVMISISMGEHYPIVRVNNILTHRRDEAYLYSQCMLCCCCSITAVLDDFEQAEYDADHGCVLF